VTIEADVLRRLIAEDDLDLLTLPAKSDGLSRDERLVASFAEITEFVKQEGRPPREDAGDVGEMKLAMRLAALAASDEKREALEPYDELGLLREPEPPATVAEAAAEDPLGLLDGSEGIFELRNVPKPSSDPSDPARRRPCEDFGTFEPLFAECHEELRKGVRKLIDFTDEQGIRVGQFFVLNGVLVYIAEAGELEIKDGRKNTRLRCIFDNGTEANLLLRSLSSRLYRFGKRVTEPQLATHEAVEQQLGELETGYVYVMRSLSEDPQVTRLADLHKIGFTSRSPEERSREADASSSFLGAPVKLVESFEMSRGVARMVEGLLHRFFAGARLDVWLERDGATVAEMKEWFAVPLAAIEEAIDLIEAGTIESYEYDPKQRAVRLQRA